MLRRHQQKTQSHEPAPPALFAAADRLLFPTFRRAQRSIYRRFGDNRRWSFHLETDKELQRLLQELAVRLRPMRWMSFLPEKRKIWSLIYAR
jgi:hypothetical protein